MIDFSRTYCDLHPNQLVSNFCCKQECLVGLCATCICSHTEIHIQKKTSPEYENIRTTYSNIQESIRTRITSLENEKQRINIISEVIQTKRKHIGEIIEQVRTETIDFVNKFFESKQKEIIRKIEADQKKLGLHNENRMDSLLNLISRDLSSLFSSAQELSSQNFLESYQRIQTQVIANSLETQKEISLELDKNENYETLVSVNPQYIHDIKAGLQNSIQVIFNQKKCEKVIVTKNINTQPVKVNDEVLRVSRIRNNESISSNNPLVMNNAQHLKRVSESLPKYSQIFASHPSSNPSSRAYPTNIYPQNIMGYPSQQNQITSQRRPESFMYNSTTNPQHLHQNQVNSRIDFRGNSSEKGIKENTQKYLVHNNLTENTLLNNQSSQISVNHLNDLSKKIRKSGLTVLKTVENQNKAS